MRIPADYHAALVLLSQQHGKTTGLTLEEVNWLIGSDLVVDGSTQDGWRLLPNARGKACIDDEPLDDGETDEQPTRLNLDVDQEREQLFGAARAFVADEDSAQATACLEACAQNFVDALRQPKPEEDDSAEWVGGVRPGDKV